MNTVTLGTTGITVNKNGFGALPIQRISNEDAVHLIRKAYQAGITFFDTARFYTDSEEKIGYAFLLNSNLHTNAACYGLRPVVSFNINRLNISDTTKTGTETAPWEIK